MMTDRSVYYSPEFIKDFGKAAKKHRSFPDDFDKFLKTYQAGGNVDARIIPDMPDRCTGFTVSKARKFFCRDIGRGSRSGYRVIFTEYRGSVLFVECYFKGNNENENRPRICGSLSTVRDGSCENSYVKKTKPNSRELLRHLK